MRAKVNSDPVGFFFELCYAGLIMLGLGMTVCFVVGCKTTTGATVNYKHPADTVDVSLKVEFTR